jgi:RNA polymerase sigma-70 factor (ECF subfamily)
VKADAGIGFGRGHRKASSFRSVCRAIWEFATDRLPDAQARVIRLRFVEQKSIREIARTLERSEGAVKQLQLRALENLRAQLEAVHG